MARPPGTRRASAADERPTRRVYVRRRLMALGTISVVLVGFLLFAVFPTRSWLDQRDRTAEAEAELAALREERAEVEREQEALDDPDEIERIAREEHNYVEPGEEAYRVLPGSTDPIGLPEGWPFTGVERVLGAS